MKRKAASVAVAVLVLLASTAVVAQSIRSTNGGVGSSLVCLLTGGTACQLTGTAKVTTSSSSTTVSGPSVFTINTLSSQAASQGVRSDTASSDYAEAGIYAHGTAQANLLGNPAHVGAGGDASLYLWGDSTTGGWGQIDFSYGAGLIFTDSNVEFARFSSAGIFLTPPAAGLVRLNATTVTSLTAGMCDADAEVSDTYKYSKTAGANISVCVCEKAASAYAFKALSATGDCT